LVFLLVSTGYLLLRLFIFPFPPPFSP
jgi:hypothetical protein